MEDATHYISPTERAISNQRTCAPNRHKFDTRNTDGFLTIAKVLTGRPELVFTSIAWDLDFMIWQSQVVLNVERHSLRGTVTGTSRLMIRLPLTKSLLTSEAPLIIFSTSPTIKVQSHHHRLPPKFHATMVQLLCSIQVFQR